MRSHLLCGLTVLPLLLFISGCHSPASPESEVPRWIPQQLERSASIRGLSVVDEQVAWLGGSGSTIARTIDGGTTWTLLPAPLPDSLDFRDIEAFDSLRAVVMSAGPGDQSRIYRTDDGGRSWQLALLNRDSAGFFNGIAFWNERQGLLTGDPPDGALYIAVTEDGGSSWQRIDPNLIPAVDSLEYGFAASGTHITVVQDSLAWIGTGGAKARVFRSGDRGRTWAAYPTPIVSGASSTGVFSLAFLPNGTSGVAVGGDYARDTLVGANVATTADGGRSWQLVTGHDLPYRSVVRQVDGIFLTAGPRGSDLSHDLGRSWQRIDTTGYHVIAVGNGKNAVWAAGSGGRVAKLSWE